MLRGEGPSLDWARWHLIYCITKSQCLGRDVISSVVDSSRLSCLLGVQRSREQIARSWLMGCRWWGWRVACPALAEGSSRCREELLGNKGVSAQGHRCCGGPSGGHTAGHGASVLGDLWLEIGGMGVQARELR